MSIDLAEQTWGIHPIDWPQPPMKRPRFWQRKTVARLRELEAVFGHLDDDALHRYWQAVYEGQSVYEDCGGYLLRCYRALIDEDIILPYRYEDAVADLLPCDTEYRRDG